MDRYKDSDRFPVRKSPRLKHFDYTSVNYYFVTICTWNKKCLFGNSGQLNVLGKIAEQGLLNIEAHFPGVIVDKYVVMPNHVHAILVIEKAGSSLSTVLGQYKAFVSKEIHIEHPDLRIWQTSFHDHVIRNQTAYEQIWLYIHSNPSNWEKDCFYLPRKQKEPTASAGS